MKIVMLLAGVLAGAAVLAYVTGDALPSPQATVPESHSVADPGHGSGFEIATGASRQPRPISVASIAPHERAAERRGEAQPSPNVPRVDDGSARDQHSEAQRLFRIGTETDIPGEGSFHPDVDSAIASFRLRSQVSMTALGRRKLEISDQTERIPFAELDGPKIGKAPWKNEEQDVAEATTAASIPEPHTPRSGAVQQAQPAAVTEIAPEVDRSGANYLTYEQHLYRAQIGRRAFANEVTKFALETSRLKEAARP